MNIDEYRAMVAKESEEVTEAPPEAPVVETQTDESVGVEADVQTNENPTDAPEQTVQTSIETSTVPEQTSTETEGNEPTTIKIGEEELSLEEVRQGYLRQSDYTKKTQEISRIKQDAEVASQYFEAINTDPEFAESVANRFDLPYNTPQEAQMKEMTDNYHALLLEREVEKLQSKHKDVDVDEVIQTAIGLGTGNLEDAYLFAQAKKGATQNTPTLDIEAIKEQIRQELTNELKSEVDTTSLIGGRGSAKPVSSSGPELTNQEMKVARGMGLSATEYEKWKTIKQ